MAAINADPALTRVAIYCRVSDDRRGGRSVDQQEAELRADCTDRGWTVVAVITDDDVGASAYSKGDRPGWRKVLAMAEAGDIDVIATWESSRGQRDLEVYVLLRRLCIDTGTRWYYAGRVYDMANWRDRRDTARDAVDDEASSGQTSERGRRDARAAALAGRPHGRRQFGYRRIYDPASGELVGQEPWEDPVPGPPGAVAVLLLALGHCPVPYTTAPEAEVVRRMFAECLAGLGTEQISEGLNNDCITTTMGCRWTSARVSSGLDNESYAGRRFHLGRRVAEGGWPAIIDPDMFERVQDRRRARRGVRQAPNARLLSAVGRCGVCGAKIAVAPKSGTDQRHYRCRADGGHVAREMGRLDAFVTGTLWARLARPDTAAALADARAPDPRVVEAEAKIIDLRARLDEATAQFTADDPGDRITAVTLARIEADLIPRIADAERAARSVRMPLDLPDLPGDPDAIPAWWDAQPMGRRREIVGAYIASVTIAPVGRGRRYFDDDEYTTIEWRR